MKVFLFLWLSGLSNIVTRRTSGGANDNRNVAPFHTLCGIYHLALDLTKEDTPGKVVARVEVDNALDEIKRLFALTADDAVFAQGPKPENKEGESSEEEKARIERWSKWKETWIGDEIEKDGRKSKKYPRPPNTQMRVVANTKIKRIQEQALLLESQIKSIDDQAVPSKEQIKKLALDAIYGENNKNVVVGSFEDNYANGCGDGVTGRATGPGKSLANDMVCLCIGASSDLGKGACGESRVGASLSSDQYNAAAGAVNAWPKISGNCYHPGKTVTPTVSEILGALAAFRSQVGANVETSTGTTGMEAVFGGPAQDATGCVGTGSAGRLCVNYKNQLTTNEAGFEGIKWYRAMKEIVEKLTSREREQGRIPSLQARISSLEELAQQTYVDPMQATAPATSGNPAPTSNPEAVTTNVSPEAAHKTPTQGTNAPQAPAVLLSWTFWLSL